MPEISEDQLRWMRNRFVEMLHRTETLSEQLVLMRDELNRVVDAIGRLLPDSDQE